MIPRGCESRDGTRIILVLIHTNEGPHDPTGGRVDRSAEDLAAYLDQPGVEASYHALCDDDGITEYLPDDVASWSAFSANHRSLNLCFIGWAHWARSDWLAHDSMLRFGAAHVQAWCLTHNIPPVKLTPQDMVAQRPGMGGHADWTKAALIMNPQAPDSHTDPGGNFPWDVFLGYVNPIAHRKDHTVMDELPPTPAPADPKSDPKTWPQRNYDIGFDIAGGWEGDVAIEFGAQDWGGRTGDDVRGFLYLASWRTPAGLVPADPVYTVAGGGRPIHAHTPTVALVAPKGATALTVNYAAPGGAWVAQGRSA